MRFGRNFTTWSTSRRLRNDSPSSLVDAMPTVTSRSSDSAVARAVVIAVGESRRGDAGDDSRTLAKLPSKRPCVVRRTAALNTVS